MEPFKNKFSPQLVASISYHLAKHINEFDSAGFESRILDILDSLELKERSQLIADHVHRVLPENSQARHKVLYAMLHPEEVTQSGEQQSDYDGIRGWGMMPLCAVVGQHGLDTFEESLLLLKEMTKRFSSEFDVRYFLLADQQRALNVMSAWVDDPNRHVRRLVSEGTRPRLPWAMQLPQLIADPSPVLPLLEALRDDSEEYVRRSVANHLNDIAKDHPELVAEIAREWLQDATPKRVKLVRHACRTLIKQGHPKTLEAFGLQPAKLELVKLRIETPNVVLGDALVFSAELKSKGKTPQELMVDYVIHFVKSNGNRAAKVFKWKKLVIKQGETVTLSKSHPIRAITTRRYYSGVQAISLRINGEDTEIAEFNLDVGS